MNVIKRVRFRLRYIKWWFQRVNGKLPACDAWDLHNTLAHVLIEGIDRLLNGKTDWNEPSMHEMHDDLIYVKKVMGLLGKNFWRLWD